ncbi:MAG TPA: cobalamin-binding protein [Firmicutes bacterium]|nr:cobalamin-binding protein [Bacillota bacterium]
MNAEILENLASCLLRGDQASAAETTRNALEIGIPATEILDKGLIAGMAVVGEKFKNNEIYLPEVIMAARAMHAAMDILRPLLAISNTRPLGKVVLGTVRGDVHDIGKKLVGMMLEGGGFQVIDLGTNISPQQFVKAVEEFNPTHIGMSALLTTTMPAMKDTINALIAAGLRHRVKVMIGGAPVTQAYCDKIGADGYAPDAASAVELARRLLV